MSAALALDPALDFGAPTGRPRLSLVPTGADVPATPTRPVHLTRRGRLARLVALLVVLAALAWAAVGTLAAGAAGSPRQVTVQSGETLWQIASRELPQLPTSDGVAQLQLTNGLRSSEIRAGQVIQIPAGG
jgi:Tfp pilus assembly protein FimV